ncbi:CcmD family protein [Persicimonas caeni]|uniref:CcmD family protein n=2 Tax=Persicimonas caeni TaxID=2292766 RepID=A0A4Y6PYX9_PERCE|nr:CcmD family protein [Persicimonas caeni]QED34429.1 CcmD family protein [Persicimonas caeni]
MEAVPMKSLVSASIFALVNLAWAGVAFAQGGAGSLAGQETSIPGGTLALAAYIALWILIFGFLMITMRRQRAIDNELTELERRMDEVFDDLDKK